MAKEDESNARKATAHECETNDLDYKRVIEKLRREVESLREKIETKDYIIEDLFTDLGKAENARDTLKKNTMLHFGQ